MGNNNNHSTTISWDATNLKKISPGNKSPSIVNAIIEIPKGCKAKYEIDPITGVLKLDRILSSAVHYPANYGFIPSTLSYDGDPLDILVICSVEILPMVLVEAKVIGGLHMIDENKRDDKIISVATGDITFSNINTLEDLYPNTLEEIKKFFADYKELENKKVIVKEVLDVKKAKEVIKESIEKYNSKFHINTK